MLAHGDEGGQGPLRPQLLEDIDTWHCLGTNLLPKTQISLFRVGPPCKRPALQASLTTYICESRHSVLQANRQTGSRHGRPSGKQAGRQLEDSFPPINQKGVGGGGGPVEVFLPLYNTHNTTTTSITGTLQQHLA